MSAGAAPLPPHLACLEPVGRRGRSLYHRARVARDLAAARALVPEIVRERAPGWVVRGAAWTETGRAVVHLGAPGAGPVAVLRMCYRGGRRLERETQVLAEVAALAPSDLAEVLPARLWTGRVGAWTYVVDRWLPGRPADLAQVPDTVGLRAAAGRLVSGLHRQTRAQVVCGQAQLAHWVDAPADVLRPLLTPAPRRLRAALERLCDVLRDELSGTAVDTGWVHGDYWAGNLLVDATGRITGVVDWDLSAPGEPVSLDLCHLLLAHRMTDRGVSLGRVVASFLDGEEWDPAERSALERSQALYPSPRSLVLLFWLRHVAVEGMHRRSYARHTTLAWDGRNVLPVLRRV